MRNSILLVEDNASDEKLTLLAFRRHNLVSEIIVQRDGADAIDYLFGAGKYAGRDVYLQPAVVLLDLNLPRIDGVEVLRRIRADERTRTLPVVMLTASTEEEDVVRCFQLGANAYVRKPVDFSEFVEAARTLGHFWLRMNERAKPPRAPA